MSKTYTYDLEDRTLKFAKDVGLFVRKVPKDICNTEDSRQLVRSSGSIGSNYREANEALSKRDFKMRIKISRKEAKESGYWLQLINTKNDAALENRRQELYNESVELLKILSSILIKAK